MNERMNERTHAQTNECQSIKERPPCTPTPRPGKKLGAGGCVEFDLRE